MYSIPRIPAYQPPKDTGAGVPVTGCAEVRHCISVKLEKVTMHGVVPTMAEATLLILETTAESGKPDPVMFIRVPPAGARRGNQGTQSVLASRL